MIDLLLAALQAYAAYFIVAGIATAAAIGVGVLVVYLNRRPWRARAH